MLARFTRAALAASAIDVGLQAVLHGVFARGCNAHGLDALARLAIAGSEAGFPAGAGPALPAAVHVGFTRIDDLVLTRLRRVPPASLGVTLYSGLAQPKSTIAAATSAARAESGSNGMRP
jgi:hypothetical protein